MALDQYEYRNYQKNFNKIITFGDALKEKKLDLLTFKKFLNSYFTLQSSNKEKMPNMVLEMLDFTEYALNRINFGEKQKEYLIMFMYGYKDVEIARYYNVKVTTVNVSIKNSTKKIIKELESMVAGDRY